jgi:alkanesulfonate monooxygenase
VHDYVLRPAGTYRSRPPIYVGGESEAARALVAEAGDYWLINGRPPAELAPLVADVRARPRTGEPLRFGLSALVIARSTAAEAHAHHAHLLELADGEVNRAARPRNVDPEVAMHKALAHIRHGGTNGGTAAELVGNYEEVAARIRGFADAGITTSLFQFQPFEADMRTFAEHVLPRLR